jgi:hypothetical protein
MAATSFFSLSDHEKAGYYNFLKAPPVRKGEFDIAQAGDGRLALVAYDGDSESYDMENDPREEHNLYNDKRYSLIRNGLVTRLFHWYMETSDITPYERQSRVTPMITP